MRPRLSALFVPALSLVAAGGCLGAAANEYWWEEGYPFAAGAARPSAAPRAFSGAEPSRGIPSRAPVPREGAGASAVARMLERMLVPALSIRGEESLRGAVEALRIVTGLPLVVDPAAEAAALDAGAVFELELTNPLAARHALDLIVEQAGEDVAWTIRHEAILVTTRAKARGELVTRAHDVRVLTASRTDFVAPRIGDLRTIDELEDEDGGTPFGGVEAAAPAFDEDELVALVQENVAPGTWEDEGVSITAENGLLFVVQTPDVQRAVAHFLSRLSGI